MTRARAKAVTAVAVAALVAANGFVASSSAATGPPAIPAPGSAPAKTAQPDSCDFGGTAGVKPVTVTTSATLPKFVESGKSVQVKDFSLTVELPREVLDATTSVSGGGTVRLTAAHDDKKTPVPVVLTIPDTPVPATGDVTLTAVGKVPDVTMAASGVLTLTAGAPTLSLGAGKTITCTAPEGGLLGSIALLPAPKTARPAEKPDAAPRIVPDPTDIVTALLPFEVRGTSSIRKLGAFARLSPGLMVDAVWIVPNPDPPPPTPPPSHIVGTTILPPTDVSFLGFGFVPITATMELLPPDFATGNHVVDIVGTVISEPDGSSTVESTLNLYAKLSNVRINGVPLDVGGHCLTARPIELNVRGTNYDLFNGGVLKTDPDAADPRFHAFTLPPFSGCGATEDLDPILTRMGSGPGNQACVGVTQVTGDGSPPPPERKCANVDPPAAKAPARKGVR